MVCSLGGFQPAQRSGALEEAVSSRFIIAVTTEYHPQRMNLQRRLTSPTRILQSAVCGEAVCGRLWVGCQSMAVDVRGSRELTF